MIHNEQKLAQFLPRLTWTRTVGWIIVALCVMLFVRVWQGISEDQIASLLITLHGLLNTVATLIFLWKVGFLALEWYANLKWKPLLRTELHTPLELPDEFVEWEDELRRLGFEEFGVYSMGDKPLENLGWAYIDESRTVVATIFQTPEMKFLTFSTLFGDAFELEISYKFPLNINVDRPNLFGANLTSSISSAYDYHLHHYDRLQAERGKPLTFNTLQDHFPNPETLKKQMRQILHTRTCDALAIIGITATVIVGGILQPTLTVRFGSLAAAATIWLIIGLPMALFDYEAVFKRLFPVDRRKTRKPHDE